MQGKLVAIKGINRDFPKNVCVIDTYHKATNDEIEAISFISSRPISADHAERPNEVSDQWGVVCVDDFVAGGGKIGRSPDGTLQVEVSIGHELARSSVGNRMFIVGDQSQFSDVGIEYICSN